MANKNLPANLNQVDAFLRSHPDHELVDSNFRGPSETIHAAMAEPKQAAAAKLRRQVEHLEWQITQHKEEVRRRREALMRRCEHVHDAQTLYGVAFGQVLSAPMSELEQLVDRMVHQIVP